MGHIQPIHFSSIKAGYRLEVFSIKAHEINACCEHIIMIFCFDRKDEWRATQSHVFRSGEPNSKVQSGHEPEQSTSRHFVFSTTTFLGPSCFCPPEKHSQDLKLFIYSFITFENSVSRCLYSLSLMSNHDPLASNGHTQLTPISVLPNTNTTDELRDARRELTLLRRQLARAEEDHKKDVARLQEHLNEQIHLTEVDLKEARKERDDLLRRGSGSPIAEAEREAARVKKEEAEKLSRDEEKRGLESEVESLRTRVSELERERDTERDRAARFEKLAQELKTMSEKLASENSQLVKINGELVDQVDALKSERRGLRDERDMAKATLDVVQAQHDGSVADRDELTRERDDLRAERDELLVIRDELTAERDTLLEERQIRETLQAVSPSTSPEYAPSPAAEDNPQQGSTPPTTDTTQSRVKVEPGTLIVQYY